MSDSDHDHSLNSSDQSDHPHRAFDTIAEEHKYLGEFLDLVSRKLDADKEYLKELEREGRMFQAPDPKPQWAKSSIWPLISPLLSYFEDERRHLVQSIHEVTSILAKLNGAPYPYMPGIEYINEIDALHEQEQRELRIVRQIDAQSVSRWRAEAKTPRDSLLLEQDRNHRRAVWRQNYGAERATDCYVKIMPTVLENHHQHAENIKSGIQAMLTRYSEVASELSSSCSSGINQITAFVSSAFIAPRHDEVEQERSHIMLQKAEYKNPVDGFRTARPLLGLPPRELFRIMQQVIESFNDGTGLMVWSVPENGVWLDPVFELERACLQSDLSILFKARNSAWKFNFLKALFWSSLPPITITDSDARQYKGGIPRGQMPSALSRFVPSGTRKVLSMMVQILDLFRQEKINDPFPEISRDLTHREDTENLVRSIWRKWDTKNDCPLPDGVERAWGRWSNPSDPAKLIWIKTGDEYVDT